MEERQSRQRINYFLQYQFMIARRIATDLFGFFHCGTAIRKALINPENKEEQEFHRSLLRGNRYMQYMSSNKYLIKLAFLGRGSFGKVELVVLKNNYSKPYALKTILLDHDNLSGGYSAIVTEKEVMYTCKSKYVVELFAAWVENGYANKPDCICFLCEYMARGDLFAVIRQLYPMTVSKTDRAGCRLVTALNHMGNFPKSAKLKMMKVERNLINSHEQTHRHYMQIIVFYATSLLEAVNFLHSKNIVHRDLEPANILVDYNLRLKLADFGMATAFSAAQHACQFGYFDNDGIYNDMAFRGLIEMKDVTTVRRAFLRYRHREEAASSLIYGTEYYTPPEMVVSDHVWDRLFHESLPEIRISMHFPTDWFAVGCVIGVLCNGINPVQAGLIHRLAEEDDELSETEKEKIYHKILAKPVKYNRFLYPSLREYQHVFGDRRLLYVVKKLLRGKPFERATGTEILESEDFKSLQTNYPHPADRPLFTWNQYLHEGLQSEIEPIWNEFRRTGVSQYNLLENAAESVAVEAGDRRSSSSGESRRIPNSVMLPMTSGRVYLAPTPPSGSPQSARTAMR